MIKTGPSRIKHAFALAALLFAATLFFAQTAATQTSAALSPQEKRGKQIYLKGQAGEGAEIVAIIGGSDLEVPATSFTCANCHGLRGEGTKEGGLQPPPIDWETLKKSHTSALTRRERVPYTDETLARAISAGLDPAGQPLHPGMPRYRMARAQMADLIAYLKKLGQESDVEPGLTDEIIRVGAALPLSGPLAQIGEDIKATLAASFAEVNSQGGIYGRRFELVLEDSRGEPAQTLEATRRLIEQDNVFALVGSFEPGDSTAVNELIKSREIPLVGPITLSPKLAVPPNPFIFYLLPTFADQARTLVDFAAARAKTKPARLAVISAESDFDRDALAGFKAQAKMYAMEIVFEQSYQAGHLEAAQTVAALARKKPDYLFLFGGAEDIKALAGEMEKAKLSVPLLSSVVMMGRSAFNLPASLAARTFLAFPSALPAQNDFAEFIALMQKSGVGLRSPAFQSVAFAATKIFFEAGKLSSRQLNRTTLVNSLEQLQDFRTGVVPPVTFGPNRRVGSRGSHIVGVDPEKKQYLPLTDRLSPKEQP
ncbi:MAG TPA: ABC transporter substrate-binding protein [Pyrinomonadaceae bacterium]